MIPCKKLSTGEKLCRFHAKYSVTVLYIMSNIPKTNIALSYHFNIIFMYIWDERKSQQNKQKHGISFEEAKEFIFEQRNVLAVDVAYDKGEPRHAVIGKYQGKYYVGIFTLTKNGEIRIISVRRARNEETKQAKEKGL